MTRTTTFVAADLCWRAYRAAAVAANAPGAARLPEDLAECTPEDQATWYGQACFVTYMVQGHGPLALANDAINVPVPGLVDASIAAEQRRVALTHYWALFGFYG